MSVHPTEFRATGDISEGASRLADFFVEVARAVEATYRGQVQSLPPCELFLGREYLIWRDSEWDLQQRPPCLTSLTNRSHVLSESEDVGDVSLPDDE